MSGGVQFDEFTEICLIWEVKFGDDPLSSWWFLATQKKIPFP